jgi:hypothetical protein
MNNKQLAMSDDNGFMDASAYRTHYNNNTLSTIVNYDLLIADAGSSWGPNHEIGHTNQYAFQIVGTSEVSNNALTNFAIFDQGTHVSRGNNMYNQILDFENKVPYVVRGESMYGSKLFSMTRMYFQLFLYFHAAGKDTTFVAEASSKEYKLYWGLFLSDFAAHLRSKGWFEKTIIAMDERPAEAMLAAFETIFTADPDFKVSLAGKWHPELERDLFDYCVDFRRGTPSEVVKKRQSEGKVSTWYTCCAERFPNSYMVSPLEEGIWIGWRTLAAGYDGYLRWSYNHWTKDPVADARFRRWPAGDCYFVYPGGRSSRRFDKIVEGIQDYEKARILRAEWEAAGDTLKLQTLQSALDKFTYETIEAEGAAPAVRQAKSALDQ